MGNFYTNFNVIYYFDVVPLTLEGWDILSESQEKI